MPGYPPAHIASARAKLGALVRHRPPDDPELADARRELIAANLEDQVRKAVAKAPPLTESQLTRLTAILRGDGGADALA